MIYVSFENLDIPQFHLHAKSFRILVSYFKPARDPTTRWHFRNIGLVVTSVFVLDSSRYPRNLGWAWRAAYPLSQLVTRHRSLLHQELHYAHAFGDGVSRCVEWIASVRLLLFSRLLRLSSSSASSCPSAFPRAEEPPCVSIMSVDIVNTDSCRSRG